LYIDESKDQNGIAIHGTAEQIKEVKAALAALGENPANQMQNVRIITLSQGRELRLSPPELKRLFPQIPPQPGGGPTNRSPPGTQAWHAPGTPPMPNGYGNGDWRLSDQLPAASAAAPAAPTCDQPASRRCRRLAGSHRASRVRRSRSR